MSEPPKRDRPTGTPPPTVFLLTAWRWLVAPLAPASTAAGRGSRMLAALLLTLLPLTFATVLLIPLGTLSSPIQRTQYIPFILGLDACLVIAYTLNAAGHYTVAACVTVLCSGLAPWVALLIDPAILMGDYIPLAYASLSVLLCSILLTPFITALLALLQLAGYALIAVSGVSGTSLNWLSLLVLLFFASVLSILSSVIRRDNIAEIDRQTRRLAEREAALRELAVRDHLTGLFNRRYLEETLEREIRRSMRSRHPIGIILMDVDQFKAANDRWGHAAGDLVLKQVGELCMKHIRGGDIACRYGGDEFVIVLPEAARQVTLRRAEALLAAVTDVPIDYQESSLGALTISAGVASYPQNGSTAEALIKAADAAMYGAKNAGGDCVVVAAARGQERAARQ